MADTLDSLTVLLIEDNPNDALLVKKYLGGTEVGLLPDEIEIHHETSLEDGLDVLAETEIELLLLDLGLPESDGKGTFEQVQEETVGIPVIVLTGLQDEQAAVELVKEGAQDFLMKKNLDRPQLIKSVRYALERQQQKSQLRTTTEQLEILNRILRHDVRNDLQIQRLKAQSLQAQLDDNDEIEGILETNDHILSLTENSKEYIDFIAGEEEVTRKPIQLENVLLTEIEKARSSYGNAEFTVNGSFRSTVWANEMLSSVFRNLLSNAVIHNDTEIPKIDISVEEQSETTRVAVTDNGPGVPDDQKETIVGKGELGLDSPGTGIGLYLVQTLVSAYQGQVWVEDAGESTNETLSGARFVVELETAQS